MMCPVRARSIGMVGMARCMVAMEVQASLKVMWMVMVDTDVLMQSSGAVVVK